MTDRKETERQLPVIREDSEPARRPRAHAVVYLHDTSFFIHLEEGRTVVLGRSDEADIEVETPTVSRRHLALRWAAGELTARDCGSTNGTLIDGRALRGEAVLRGGEEITIGDAVVVAGIVSPLPVARRIVSEPAFREQLGLEALRAARLGRSLAVVVLRFDVDEATAGATLDDVLRALPVRATSSCSGPAEYLILVPDVSLSAMLPPCRAVLSARGLAAEKARVGGAEYPAHAADVTSLLQRARAAVDAEAEGVDARRQVDASEEVVAADPVTVRLLGVIKRVARSDGTVLLLGETGVGKDVFARQLHRSSPRSARPFVHVNCGAIPSTLFEREMFGHERGAFTGAKDRCIGLFEAASGGTLFLDEIAEIPLSDQVRLLRAIEARRIVRVGGNEELPVDIRIVAATNRDLEDLASRGEFREDLLYRLTVLNVFVPALRDRPGDVGPLAERFFREITAEADKEGMSLAEDAVPVLERYGWPGNVRELRNVVERSIVLAPGERVTGNDLLGVLYGEPLRGVDLDREVTLRALVEEVERHAVLRALDGCGQNQGLAAEQLGISRRTLIYKMRRYAIPGRGQGVH